MSIALPAAGVAALVAAVAGGFRWFTDFLWKYKELVLRAVLIGLGLWMVGIIANHLTDFVVKVVDLMEIDEASGGETYLNFINYLVPLEEIISQMVLLLSLSVSVVSFMLGVMGCKFVFRIVTQAGAGS